MQQKRSHFIRFGAVFYTSVSLLTFNHITVMMTEFLKN